jgi:hypothetical protein
VSARIDAGTYIVARDGARALRVAK